RRRKSFDRSKAGVRSRMNDFYVGYFPKAPARLARFVIGIVAGLLALSVAVAVVRVLVQNPFPASRFEYGVVRTYEGFIQHQPYPMLVTNDSFFALVAPGKHGFSAPVEGAVKLTGSLIKRGPNTMLEVSHIESEDRHRAVLIETPLGPVTI